MINFLLFSILPQFFCYLSLEHKYYVSSINTFYFLFMYFFSLNPVPLDYILPEILKNAVRATIESHSEYESGHLPPIHLTIASNERDFIIR